MKRYTLVLVLLSILSLTFLPVVRADEATVLSELDKVEKTQAQILQQLDEIKAELQIVKIRASLKS